MKEQVVLAAARRPLTRARVCYACVIDRPKGTPFPAKLAGKSYLSLGGGIVDFVYCRKHERRGLEIHGYDIYRLSARLQSQGLL